MKNLKKLLTVMVIMALSLTVLTPATNAYASTTLKVSGSASAKAGVKRDKKVYVYTQVELEKALKQKDVKTIVINSMDEELLLTVPSGTYLGINLIMNTRSTVVFEKDTKFNSTKVNKGSTKVISWNRALDMGLIEVEETVVEETNNTSVSDTNTTISNPTTKPESNITTKPEPTVKPQPSNPEPTKKPSKPSTTTPTKTPDPVVTTTPEPTKPSNPEPTKTPSKPTGESSSSNDFYYTEDGEYFYSQADPNLIENATFENSWVGYSKSEGGNLDIGVIAWNDAKGIQGTTSDVNKSQNGLNVTNNGDKLTFTESDLQNLPAGTYDVYVWFDDDSANVIKITVTD